MAGPLFFISLFFITLIGGLLLRPDPIQSIRDYEKPAVVESRKQVAREMAEFLVRNPKIVEQNQLKALPLGPARIEIPSEPTRTGLGHGIPSSNLSDQNSYEVRFQSQLIRFKNRSEYDAWLYESVKSGGAHIATLIEFGDQYDFELDTLKMIHEIDPSPEGSQIIKNAYLERGKAWIQKDSPGFQQAAAKAFEGYLGLESDRELGQKTVDEIVQSNSKPHP